MANKPFQKFIEKKENGAKKKERIRQEKKKLRLETKEYFEKKKTEARMLRAQGGTRSWQQPDQPAERPRAVENPKVLPLIKNKVGQKIEQPAPEKPSTGNAPQ